MEKDIIIGCLFTIICVILACLTGFPNFREIHELLFKNRHPESFNMSGVLTVFISLGIILTCIVTCIRLMLVIT